MRFKTLTPMLYSSDVPGTIAFYTTVLGFTCDNVMEDAHWASLRRDDVTIMISVPNEHIPFEKPILTGSLYLQVEDVDAIWQKLESKANVCYPIENFDYGMREFAIYDNNGYLLQFGQEIATLNP